MPWNGEHCQSVSHTVEREGYAIDDVTPPINEYQFRISHRPAIA